MSSIVDSVFIRNTQGGRCEGLGNEKEGQDTGEGGGGIDG